jgi:SAM-dependent methyltransferase
MTREQILSAMNRYVERLERAGSPLLRHPGFPAYRRDLVRYLHIHGHEERINLFPCLDDGTSETPLDKHYFYQDTWAARKIFEIAPKRVVDVGSTALLVGIISQFVPTISVDVRPLPVSLPGLTCKNASITDLPFEDSSVELMSSMCVIEHIGLGRYGDELDTQGSNKAFREVSRVLARDGHFLFSVPLSHVPGVSFNAHRIFSKQQVQALLPDFVLQEEQFLFPEPGSEADVARLQGFQFCVWCAHMVKSR